MASLTLRIKASGPDLGWKGRWSVGPNASGDWFPVEGPRARDVLDVGRRFLGLFDEQRGRPMADPEFLRTMGRTLFDAWLAPALDHLGLVPAPDSSHPRKLILRTDDPSLLDLPWELVEITPGLPIGCDAGWSLHRASTTHRDPPEAPAPPGPLRVLFLASAPVDQDQLDYEREEDLMLRASSDVKGEIVAHFAETGGIDELAKLVDECKPHVVHLSGHGDVDSQGRGRFCFEDERGLTDLRTADEIANLVFRGHNVRLAFINGCKTSQAAVAGICQGLVAAGVPSALGWAASVLDDRATEFAAEFYRRLVHNAPIPVAAAHARDALRRSGLIGRGEHKDQDATFALPQLYGTEAAAPFDSSTRVGYSGPRTTYALLGDGISGLKSGYVGRRREIQRLLPALRQGETTFAVLTGVGGTGKSTLATRAANRLQAVGYGVIPVKVTTGRDTASRLIGALDDAFLMAGRKDLHGLLTDGDIPTGQRLRLAVRGLNELKLVLVLDNFEDALDLETRRIADPDLAGFMEALAANLTQGSRALVTCRYLPEGTPTDLPNVRHVPLREFLAHDVLKFLRRDEIVDRRIAQGKLTGELIGRLYQALGGTPGLLVQVRTLLRTADPDDLLEELEGGDPGLLEQEREAYLSKILTARLHAALSPQGRSVTSRLAISLLPLPVDAVAPLLGMTEAEVGPPLAEGVAFGLIQRFEEPDLPDLYHPPVFLRPWLAAAEKRTEDEAKAIQAHLASFWRSSYEADRELHFRVAIEVELEACREHSRQADDGPTFQWSTNRLAIQLESRSEWDWARKQLEEIPEATRDALTWHNLASIDLKQGQHDAAREKLDTSLRINQAIGDRAGEAATWHKLASIDLNQGEYDTAREKLDSSLRIRQAIGDLAGEADTWHNLATIDLKQGHYDAAREKFDFSLRINQAIGDRAGEADTTQNLATIDFEQGQYDAAREKFDSSLRINQAIGNRAGEATSWNNLASIDLKQGQHDAAREKLDSSLRINQAIGNRAGEATSWHNLASIDLEQGQHDAAREKLDSSLRINQAIGDRAGEAATWHQLATIDLEQGHYDAAREKLDTSLRINQAIGNRLGEASTFSQLGFLALQRGRGHHAARLWFICWMVDYSIGHGDAEREFRDLSTLCSELGYDQAQFEAMMVEVSAAYQADRGWSLIEQAFAEDELGGSE